MELSPQTDTVILLNLFEGRKIVLGFVTLIQLSLHRTIGKDGWTITDDPLILVLEKTLLKVVLYRVWVGRYGIYTPFPFKLISQRVGSLCDPDRKALQEFPFKLISQRVGRRPPRWSDSNSLATTLIAF